MILDSAHDLREALTGDNLGDASAYLASLSPHEVTDLLEQLPDQPRAVAFRLLGKDSALAAFEGLAPALQRELVSALGEEDIAAVFAELDPDDRVGLLDELPAKVAKRLVQRLSPAQRELTAVVLGYHQGSIGRRMSPEYVHVRAQDSVEHAMARVKSGGEQAETIYTIPVVDAARRVLGVIGLRDLVLAAPGARVADFVHEPLFAYADEDAEVAARRCVEHGLLAMPVTDREQRLVGLLTVDDAARIVEAASTEDAARAGASEPLRRPYLLTPVSAITRSRVVWLLVLAVSGLLTVNVLGFFQATLEQRVALSLFIPLLTGIGGNTGSQAATTVTRALAMGEARSRDVGKVAFKEARTGLLMGVLLGSLGWVIASLVYDTGIGWVVGLTLIAICTIAATVGGTMPLLAKAVRVDPAVFSTPFISTFCDATGLVIYFTIARAVLQI